MSRLGDVLSALQPKELDTGEGIKELWLRAIELEGLAGPSISKVRAHPSIDGAS